MKTIVYSIIFFVVLMSINVFAGDFILPTNILYGDINCFLEKITEITQKIDLQKKLLCNQKIFITEKLKNSSLFPTERCLYERQLLRIFAEQKNLSKEKKEIPLLINTKIDLLEKEIIEQKHEILFLNKQLLLTTPRKRGSIYCQLSTKKIEIERIEFEINILGSLKSSLI